MQPATAGSIQSHATTKRWCFKVGDRVQRLSDVYDRKSRLMHGMVVKRYSDYASRFGPYPELYAVWWDHDVYEEGFLPHGLDVESQ